jgi:hypothetical protein
MVAPYSARLGSARANTCITIHTRVSSTECQQLQDLCRSDNFTSLLSLCMLHWHVLTRLVRDLSLALALKIVAGMVIPWGGFLLSLPFVDSTL